MSEWKIKRHTQLGENAIVVMDGGGGKRQRGEERGREDSGEHTEGLELVPKLQSRARQS